MHNQDSGRDRLFATSGYPKPFVFNGEVAAVFDDMVRRSIPLYEDVTSLTCQWASRMVQPETRVYDLGCSTGTTLVRLGGMLPKSVQCIGVDASYPMLQKARSHARLANQGDTQWLCEDIRQIEIGNASVVVMNYTLMFLPVRERQALLKKIYSGLVDDGILILTEKIKFSSADFQEVVTDIYENFKTNNGYSRREIERKKQALENVLVPLTEAEQRAMVEDCGFTTCETVLKWNCFMTLIGHKNGLKARL